MRHLSQAVFAIALALLPATPTVAHHGWAWATNEEFVLPGTVKSVRHGNPHGTMVLATKSGSWRKTAAIWTFCCMPLESSRMRFFFVSRRPTR